MTWIRIWNTVWISDFRILDFSGCYRGWVAGLMFILRATWCSLCLAFFQWSRPGMGINWYRLIADWGRKKSSIFYFRHYMTYSNYPAALWTRVVKISFDEAKNLHISGVLCKCEIFQNCKNIGLIIFSGEVQFCKYWATDSVQRIIMVFMVLSFVWKTMRLKFRLKPKQV